MSEHDRGAYTPQTDPPLAFDPRRPSERRPMPMALIGSGVVLAVLLAGVAMVYRGGVRHAGDSPRPVGEPVMAVKTAPNAAQTAAAAASAPPAADVYSPEPASPAATSKLAPPPEQPVARPPPSPATVALLAKPAAPDHIERPAQPADSSPSPPPAKPRLRAKVDETELAAAAGGGRQAAPAPVARTPEPATDVGPEAPPPAKPVKVATATPASPVVTSAPAASAGPSSAAVVQIGAFSSSALADKGYADVSAAVPDRMAGKAKHVLALDKGGATLYRTWLSGFADRADAVSFCEALKAKGMTCFVKGG